MNGYGKRALAKIKAAAGDSEPRVHVCGSEFYLPNGREVGPAGCNQLIEEGVLQPEGDGLFPEFTQTYRVSE